MKLRELSNAEARELIAELRAMAALPPGPDPKRLARAKEIRFQIRGQDWASDYLAGKMDEAYRFLETLLSARRWREVLSLDALRKQIKSACSLAAMTLRTGLGCVYIFAILVPAKYLFHDDELQTRADWLIAGVIGGGFGLVGTIMYWYQLWREKRGR